MIIKEKCRIPSLGGRSSGIVGSGCVVNEEEGVKEVGPAGVEDESGMLVAEVDLEEEEGISWLELERRRRGRCGVLSIEGGPRKRVNPTLSSSTPVVSASCLAIVISTWLVDGGRSAARGMNNYTNSKNNKPSAGVNVRGG